MAKHCKKSQGQNKLIKSLQVQFIFCLCLSKEGAQLLWAKKITLQLVSHEVGILPLWCCKIISATEVTGIEVVLKLSTVGELWHFSVDMWAERIGDCPCQLSPFFFCHRGRSSLLLLKSVWTRSTPQGSYVMSGSLSLFLLGLKLDLPRWLRRLNFQIQVWSSVYHASLQFPSSVFDWQFSAEALSSS